jgi:hypothetical protein
MIERQTIRNKKKIIHILIPSYYLSCKGHSIKGLLYPKSPSLSLYHEYPYNRPPPDRIDRREDDEIDVDVVLSELSFLFVFCSYLAI